MSSFSIIQTCLDVADLRCLRAEAGWLAGDGEQGGDAQGDPAEHHGHGDDGGYWQHWPAGHVLHVHPEADPGHNHDEDGGHVALDQVEADTAVQLELGGQAAVVTWQSFVSFSLLIISILYNFFYEKIVIPLNGYCTIAVYSQAKSIFEWKWKILLFPSRKCTETEG